MRYITLTVEVPDETVESGLIEQYLDKAVEVFHVDASLAQYDISDSHNETWLYGGDRIEADILNPRY